MTATSSRLLHVAVYLALTGGGLRLLASADLEPAATRLNRFPLQFETWHAREDTRLDRDGELALQADAYLLRTYERADRQTDTQGPASITLLVAYYATQRSGHTTHSPLNCLPGSGWSWVERARRPITIGDGRALEVNRNVAERHAQRILVDYWYQSRDRAIAGEYQNKMLLIRDALTLHRSDGALIRVTAPISAINPHTSREEATAFIRAAYPSLVDYLPE